MLVINNKPEPLECFKQQGLSTLCCDVREISNLISQRPIYYVSPANVQLFMDGGIDLMYMKMFDGIQKRVQTQMRNYQETPLSLLGRKYLPIGSSMLHKISDGESLICAPTMLWPQKIEKTNNAYHAMKAVLKIWPGNGLLVVPLLGGGIGSITPENVCKQIRRAIAEYTGPDNAAISKLLYIPENVDEILREQPKFYENTEFLNIDISEIIKH
jgi:O-acetyl-ADP-ribose deacetylase (regulator of RNase III)